MAGGAISAPYLKNDLKDLNVTLTVCQINICGSEISNLARAVPGDNLQ